MGRLTGKVAIITGAGSGIGKATAMLFAREGASVVVGEISTAAGERTVSDIKAAGGAATLVPVDVTGEESVRNLVAAAVRTYGRLDVMHNNAGILTRIPITECSVDDWEKVMAVNVRGVFLGCKHAIPAMIQGGGGVIINTASAAAFIASRESPAYCASKGAVLMITRQVAADYAPHGIRVNAVCPGFVETPMQAETFAKMGGVEQAKQELGARSPLGRVAQPEEIARAVLWLASDDSSFTTGGALMVDGGITAI